MITLEDLYTVDDPLRLFELTTEAIGDYQNVVDQLAQIRVRAVAALYAQGYSYKDLARILGVSAPRIGQLVSSNDGAAIDVLRAWVDLERQLADVAGAKGSQKNGTAVHQAIRALGQSPRFDQKALKDLEAIRQIRNALVHGQIDLSAEAAEEILNRVAYLSALIVLWLHQEMTRREGLDSGSSQTSIGSLQMASVEQAHRKIAQLSKDEADLRKRMSEAQSAVSAARKVSETKRQQASKTSSATAAAAYLRSAQAADRKVIDEEKKLVALSRKLSDTSRKQLTANRELQSATKAAERQRDTADARRRSTDKRHAQEIARLSQPTVRYVHEVRVVEPPKPENLRVLYLTADPDAENRLRVDVEVREVRQAVRKATHRDLVELDHRSAATPEDLLDGINEFRPHVIHFSGHGGTASLLFDDAKVDDPSGRVVSFELLARVLASTDQAPKLLVLNACDTLDGAEVLLAPVPVVVAMSASVSDLAATVFAARFYSAIASAQSVQSSLDQGAVAVDLLDLEEGWKPDLIARDGVDVRSMVLVQPTSA